MKKCNDYISFIVLLQNNFINQDIQKNMDRFSFLNAAHSEFFDQLYEQYLTNPDSVEPSWRSFFQGFDFGMATYNDELSSENGVIPQQNGQASEKLQKEFNVIRLIDGYRSRGHLFTKTNPCIW